MSKHDYTADQALEAEVRAVVQETIQPPATPGSLRVHVSEVAAEQVARRPGFFDGLPEGLARRAMAALAGFAAVAVVIAVIAATLFFRPHKTPVGGPTLWPSPEPSGTPWHGSPEPDFPTPASSPTGSVSLSMEAPAGVGAVTVLANGTAAYHVTIDAGHSWYSVQAPTPTIYFSDSRTAYGVNVVGAPGGWQVIFYRSSDGGRTWQQSKVADLGVAQTEYFWRADSHLSNAGQGLVLVSQASHFAGLDVQPIGLDCRAYTTDDGGASWSSSSAAPCLTEVDNMAWSSDMAGWIAGPNDLNGIKVTFDGGRVWQPLYLPVEWEIVTPELLLSDGPERARIVVSHRSRSDSWNGRGILTVYRTNDGGRSWSEYYTFAAPPNTRVGASGDRMFSFSMLGPQHWRALAPLNDSTGDEMVETYDGGMHWQVLPSPTTGQGATISRAFWWDDRHGIADCWGEGDSRNTVWVTDDGGKSWHVVPF